MTGLGLDLADKIIFGDHHGHLPWLAERGGEVGKGSKIVDPRDLQSELFPSRPEVFPIRRHNAGIIQGIDPVRLQFLIAAALVDDLAGVRVSHQLVLIIKNKGNPIFTDFQ